jgi:hypothetical protein
MLRSRHARDAVRVESVLLPAVPLPAVPVPPVPVLPPRTACRIQDAGRDVRISRASDVSS